MTTTALDPPETRQATTPAERLRQVAAAVRVSFVWMGVRKTLRGVYDTVCDHAALR